MGKTSDTIVVPLTGIVLSKYDWIFRIFASAYKATCSAQLIVVDDGLSDEVKEEYPDFIYIDAPDPWAFCTAVNKGIEAAPEWSDVLIFNDDTIIKTPHTDMILWSAAQKDPSLGILAPMMDNVSNVDQHPESKVPGEEYIITQRTISFTVVYIPRRVITAIGLMDEGFAVGIAGAEDRDYCLRAKEAGFKWAVAQKAFVQHGGKDFGREISNTRQREDQLGQERLNHDYFNQKHGRS
jgi:GT2 family glycosyltransferase